MWNLSRGLVILFVLYKLLPYILFGIVYFILINIKAGF